MAEMKIALSIEEAADYTGIGRNTLRKLVEWDKLPVLKGQISSYSELKKYNHFWKMNLKSAITLNKVS